MLASLGACFGLATEGCSDRRYQSGEIAPTLTSVEPAGASAGDTVQLRGAGFVMKHE